MEAKNGNQPTSSSSTKKSPKLTKDLAAEDIAYIQSKTDMPTYEIVKWYQSYLELTRGKQLDQAKFIKAFKEILPSEGDGESFARLAFHG